MEHISGVLSNWDSIEANIRLGIHTDPGQAKDIQDILDVIHDLQDSANIVSPLKDMFLSHMINDKNPHQVSVSISDLDMLQFLYDRYSIAYGMQMTFSEFCEAVLNVRRFATRLDVDNITNLNSVVNLDVMTYLVDAHNDSSEAHNNLFRYKLPGIPLSEPPAFVFEPNMGLAGLINVDRQCSMYYHDINGRVRMLEANLLPVDYLYGTPSVPIFSDKRNILLNSKSMNDVTLVGSTRNISADIFLITPTDDTSCLLLKESTLAETHGFIDVLPEEITGVVSYSLYIYPLSRQGIEIVAMDINGVSVYRGQYNFIRNESVAIEGLEVVSELIPLPNGWIRCNLAFNSSGKNVSEIRVNVTELINQTDDWGIVNYQGDGSTSMAFWQHQLTEGPLSAPPIITMNVPITILGTKISKEFTDQFNPVKGTVHARFISSLSEVFGTYSTVVRVGHNDQDPELSQSTIEINSNPVDLSQYCITSYNDDNSILSIIRSEAYLSDEPELVKRVEFSYTRGYQSYGFTNQRPQIFRHYDEDTGTVSTYDEAIFCINRFFDQVYDGETTRTGTVVLQEDIDVLPNGTIDSGDTLLQSITDLESTYRMNSNVSILEIGYNSITDKYLEGYMINFRYYSVFANRLNIEFLLDQYIPEN